MFLDLKNNPLEEELVAVAGTCTDEQECTECARKVRAGGGEGTEGAGRGEGSGIEERGREEKGGRGEDGRERRRRGGGWGSGNVLQRRVS